MIKIQKGVEKKLSKNFVSTQFDCQCKRPSCKTTVIEIFDCLDQLIDEAFPAVLTITSAFRCYLHNKDVGGLPTSYHLKGMAVDLRSKHATPQQIKVAAERVAGFRKGGIGLYSTFIHLDVRGYVARWGK